MKLDHTQHVIKPLLVYARPSRNEIESSPQQELLEYSACLLLYGGVGDAACTLQLS